MTKRPKIASPVGRSVREWIGKTPDAKVPNDVQLRIWRRQGGKDAITGVKMQSKKEAHLDHAKPLSEGGEHREANLRFILIGKHKEKTAEETKRREKADACAKREIGITAPKQKIANRGFEKSEKPGRIEKLPLPGRRDIFSRKPVAEALR